MSPIREGTSPGETQMIKEDATGSNQQRNDKIIKKDDTNQDSKPTFMIYKELYSQQDVPRSLDNEDGKA
jgi:hypothetical protein